MRHVAILIDGGFFLRRITALGHHPNADDPAEAVDCLSTVVRFHLQILNKRYGMNIPSQKRGVGPTYLTRPEHQLYRIFYYDAPPYKNRATKPISRDTINFGKSDTAVYREAMFALLKKQRAVALRLGELAASGNWILENEKQKKLLAGDISVSDLTDDDFSFDIKQKGVDMRLGLDIASLTLKKQVSTIVLVTGDGDFVSASKLARREGVEIILDPLRNNISESLFEHIDGLSHSLQRVPATESSAEKDNRAIPDD